MNLRGRIFVLFVALAAVPLILLALLNGRATTQSVEALIAEQVEQLARRAAAAVEARQALQRSDMLLLAENEETLRLLRAAAAATTLGPVARDSARQYLQAVWRVVGEQYVAMELVDAGGRVVEALGDAAAPAPAARSNSHEQPVFDPDSGARLGSVRAWPRPGSFLPRAELESRFGGSGISFVIDRSTGALVYPTGASGAQRQTTAAPHPELLARLPASSGGLRYATPDGLAIGYHVPVAASTWSVVFVSVVADFDAPFRRLGTVSLLTVLLVVLITTAAFALLLRRSTASLRALTVAADSVGGGDFAPQLPAAGRDDIGRLTTAFSVMVAKIRDMLVDAQSRRQMAVLGEFAARLSHEIRNPLTAIKLNLQGLDHDARRQRLTSAAAERPLAIALREINRLDDVLRGVLELASTTAGRPRQLRLNALLEELAQLLRPQCAARDVSVTFDARALRDHVEADPGELKGALLNLLLNALDAAPAGSAVHVSTATDEEHDAVVVRIRDQGTGVPPTLRREIFRPFVTTKPDGTGLGLPLALRVAEEAGGSLVLSDEVDDGAEFVITLPLSAAAAEPVRSGVVV